MTFFSKPASCYTNTFDDADLSDVKLPDGRFVDFVKKFPYLGSWISEKCGDGDDVESRIGAASRAFGASRQCIFSSASVTRGAKLIVYERIILAILLSGCECWCLTEKLLNKLRAFHGQCMRVMSRVTRKHTWKHHISMQTLEQNIGTDSIDFHITRRQLRWAGHVSRMPWHRTPRRMMSSWVANKRPIGAPNMTYGRTLVKAMKKFEINPKTWHELAADKELWKESLRLGRPAIRRSVRIAARPRAQLPAGLRPAHRPPVLPTCRCMQAGCADCAIVCAAMYR